MITTGWFQIKKNNASLGMLGKKAMNRCERCLLVCLFSITLLWGEENIRRGCNEGTFSIPASNVIGNGNITIASTLEGSYGTEGTALDPSIGAVIGISDIMELDGTVSFTDFKKLGTSRAKLQLTLPNNDRLRFFGVSLAVSLFLSTNIDTISASASAGKPEFHSYLNPSIVIDLDWLALLKKVPLKTYGFVSLVDEPDLLFKYHQIGVKFGIEWKMYAHSLFINSGIGQYKEKSHGTFPGDRGYAQYLCWIEPGVRYRIRGMGSFLFGFRGMVYRKVKLDRSVPFLLYKVNAHFEMPVIFREMNTEAIRTLVFLEQRKGKKTATKESGETNEYVKIPAQFEQLFNDSLISATIKEDTLSTDVMEKRESIQEKMNEIERLLNEL